MPVSAPVIYASPAYAAAPALRNKVMRIPLRPHICNKDLSREAVSRITGIFETNTLPAAGVMEQELQMKAAPEKAPLFACIPPQTVLYSFPTGAISLSKRPPRGRSFGNTGWVFVL